MGASMTATLTVVAIMCHLNVAQRMLPANRDCTAEETRNEVVVTDNELDPKLDLFSCQSGGIISAADWKTHHPIYFKSDWRVGQIKCIAGRFTQKVSS
jgi:hypothetical protein